MEHQFNIKYFYETYNRMPSSERKTYINLLRQAGINIRKITCYSYPKASGIKHAFFLFDNSKESIPYFMLDKETLSKITSILEEHISILS